MVEGPEAAAGVVEDAVEDDLHPARVAGVEQLAERGVAPEKRVDRQVVIGVVAVVRGGGEDRVEVERRDPERLQVVEPIDDAEEIAALESRGGRRRIPRLQGTGRPTRPLRANRSGKTW